MSMYNAEPIKPWELMPYVPLNVIFSIAGTLGNKKKQ